MSELLTWGADEIEKAARASYENDRVVLGDAMPDAAYVTGYIAGATDLRDKLVREGGQSRLYPPAWSVRAAELYIVRMGSSADLVRRSEVGRLARFIAEYANIGALFESLEGLIGAVKNEAQVSGGADARNVALAREALEGIRKASK